MFDLLETLPEALFTRNELYAPACGGCESATKTLERLGVLKYGGIPNETAIKIMAHSFATHFLDAAFEGCDDLFEINDLSEYSDKYEDLLRLVSIMESMQDNNEYIGLYYFVMGNSNLYSYSPPREIPFIATRREALELYFNHFTQSLNALLSIPDKDDEE